jgi:hypothetical protein
MTCWNNFDVNNVWSKGNDDVTQCVTCNISFLFVPRLKHWKNKEKINILVEQEKFPNGFEMKNNNSFLYEIEAWITLQCNLNWI